MRWEDVKEARRRLSREQGTILKDWGGRTSIALVYPNSYYVGMSNLGFQTVYSLCNADQDIVCERAFYEWRPGGERDLISLESQRPLADFDVIAFSVSYELDYVNVVQALRAAGLPPLAAQREELHPLVIAGGPCIIANPEPLAPFCDLCVVGEAEAVLPELLGVLRQGVKRERAALLEMASRVAGIYVPSRGNPTRRRWAADLDSFATTSTVLTPDTELARMFLVEVARGCARGCRFCLAGFAFRPFRARSVEALVGQVRSAGDQARRVGLIGAAAGDHPQLEALVGELREMGVEVSISSVRAERVSDAVVRALAESGTRTMTLAPEAGADRLRRVVSKDISEEDVLRAVSLAAQHNLGQVKMYFMVGLPHEADEDVADIARLVLRTKAEVDKRNARTRLVVNVAPFVPKATTPFQWLGMALPSVLGRRLRMVRDALRGQGVEVKAESAGWSLVQGALSRGDRRVAKALLALDDTSLSGWQRAMEQAELDVESLACRQLAPGDELPWQAIDSGTPAGYLARELSKALEEGRSTACPPGYSEGIGDG